MYIYKDVVSALTVRIAELDGIQRSNYSGESFVNIAAMLQTSTFD